MNATNKQNTIPSRLLRYQASSLSQIIVASGELLLLAIQILVQFTNELILPLQALLQTFHFLVRVYSSSTILTHTS